MKQLQDLADELGRSRSSVAENVQYSKLVEKSPELKKKGLKEVIKNYEIKEDKVIRKNTRVEINLNKLNSYDENMFHFSIDHGKKYTRSDAEVALDQKEKENVLTKTAKDTGVNLVGGLCIGV